eukprot:CAMPEP_0204080690 /NCGR_PEP_ID=MMETSP0360-20130528/174406_1 /ASSEMBLY_ACC=CAM_ASM_000342 /TAXON_ID=268821 /ORGANISM="Scrippsiella Hangoei, Strain SHTV-5" /LENGTH=65 /DNA_ID=CAMNT_0051029485 /DNA_START=86 /DNA_END=280 /DNA_ORIENTATION=+
MLRMSRTDLQLRTASPHVQLRLGGPSLTLAPSTLPMGILAGPRARSCACGCLLRQAHRMATQLNG